MTDPIADMLTRIRNASAVNQNTVMVPHSKLKLAIAQLLQKEGYLHKIEILDDKGKAFKEMKLTMDPKRISHISRISKPGTRRYVKKEEIPTVLNNMGIAILSTSKGLMTNKQAKREGVGGELLCEVY